MVQAKAGFVLRNEITYCHIMVGMRIVEETRLLGHRQVEMLLFRENADCRSGGRQLLRMWRIRLQTRLIAYGITPEP
jgi:hypothetical protein